MPHISTPDQMATLVSCLAKAKEDGFTEDFFIKGTSLCTVNNKCYGPSEITVENFYRFEGQRNPDDNSILYNLSATDGVKGTLSDGCGAYADPNITAFIFEVEEIKKEKTRTNREL